MHLIKIQYIAILLLICWGSILKCSAQKVAVKTNLFYGAYSGTPNLGVEWGLSPRTTIEFGAGLNWFTPNKASSNKKLVHWLGTMEYRYWTCERFSGHFGGIHIIGTQYNIAGHHLPLLFGYIMTSSGVRLVVKRSEQKTAIILDLLKLQSHLYFL